MNQLYKVERESSCGWYDEFICMTKQDAIDCCKNYFGCKYNEKHNLFYKCLDTDISKKLEDATFVYRIEKVSVYIKEEK